MSDTNTPSLAHRVGFSLFLFAMVLAGLLLVSKEFVLPHFTQVNVQGELLDAVALSQYAKQLHADIATAETKRDQLMLPVNDATYSMLKESKALYPSMEVLTQELKDVAHQQSFSGSVYFREITLNADAATLTLSGDVRNVQTRSMTVLAQFVEALRTLPFVKDIVPPSFTREEDPTIGFHSPYSITLTLQSVHP